VKFPENTLPAFQSAIDMGADFLEIDVWLTKDGESVVVHDPTYGRTTNVEEMFGENKEIGELTLAEAKTLWIDGGANTEKFKETLRVPALDEVLAMAKDKIKILFNIKSMDPKNLENIVAAVDRIGLRREDIVYDQVGFDEKKTSRLHFYGGKKLEGFPEGVEIAGPHYSVLDQEYVDQLHRMGYKVFTWTANKEKDLERIIGLGVDGVLTDDPGLMLKILGR